MTVRDLRIGDYFTLKPIDEPKESQVFARGDYNRSAKKYEAFRFSDVCDTRLLKPTTEVYTDFTF